MSQDLSGELPTIHYYIFEFSIFQGWVEARNLAIAIRQYESISGRERLVPKTYVPITQVTGVQWFAYETSLGGLHSNCERAGYIHQRARFWLPDWANEKNALVTVLQW